MNTLHLHKLNWHEVGLRFEHLVHDPRFWAGVALATILALMLLMAILSQSVGDGSYRNTMPMHPYGVPYW